MALLGRWSELEQLRPVLSEQQDEVPQILKRRKETQAQVRDSRRRRWKWEDPDAQEFKESLG